MHDTEQLDAALAGLREASGAWRAPPHLEAALLDAFERGRAARKPSWAARLRRRSGPLAGAFATGMAALTVALQPAPPPAAAPDHPFVALGAPAALARPDLAVVEAEVSGLDLAGWGVPVNPAEVGGTVRTQLLVDPEGVPVALRFVE